MENSLNRDRRNLYADFIWQLLDRGSLVVLASLLKPHATAKHLKSLFHVEVKELYRLRHALKRLERRKLIRIVEDLNDPRIELTTEGRSALAKKRFQQLSVQKPDHWDGVWRMVVFDVPEEKRYIRDVLRDMLNRLGFYQVQKSVFVHPYPCKREIAFLRQHLGTEYHMHYFEFSIPNKRYERTLKRHFGL